MGTRILVIGVSGLSNEIAKNLVLAGVGSMHILDTEPLGPADVAVGALFSVGQAPHGTPRAKALCDALQEMGPTVKFECLTTPATELGAERLAQYDFIITASGVGAVRARARAHSPLPPSPSHHAPRASLLTRRAPPGRLPPPPS